MTKFIQSEKFFMPIVYVGFGIIIYLIIAKIIDDLSKINIKHVVGKESGIDKRKKTVINLFKNIISASSDSLIIFLNKSSFIRLLYYSFDLSDTSTLNN